VEHPPRAKSVGLVFNTRLMQMPLEGDRQRAELARSLTLPILRWPNPAAAEADGARKACGGWRFRTWAAV
jgi:hypothetical protein